MIGKAVWDWICSAPKRPFIQRSYDELVELVNSADSGDIKTLNGIQEELDYRKRLKTSKREELRGLIATKTGLIQAFPETTLNCHRKTPGPENENCQEADQPKEPEENSKSTRENPREEYAEEYVFEEAGECRQNKQVKEDIKKRIDQENKKTSVGQLASTAEKGIHVNGKNQCRYTYRSDLSRKTYNALRRNGFENISELQYMSNEEILMLKWIGHKALDEIRTVFPLIENADNHRMKIERKHVTTKGNTEANYPHDQEIESEDEEEKEVSKDGCMQERILEQQFIDLRDLIKIEAFSAYREAIECLNEAIDPARKGLCMVAAINNEREVSFLLKRISGMTLEAIGEEAGVTRERVRQVTKKTSERFGIQTSELSSMLEKKRKTINESRIRLALDRDLQDHQMIGTMTRNEWREANGREMNLRDRIDMLRKLFVPIPAKELQDHLAIIEEGRGQYGGTEYWDDILILRLLINMVALKKGKPGTMPRQIEIPRLVSRYIQRRGGQRQVAQILGMSYEGPIGSRNRNYWTDSRISQAIRDTQEYFGLPEDIMPEQSQITVWLDLDENDDTKGPSCIAAIKKKGAWKDYCDKRGYKQYADQDDEGKRRIDSMILLRLWNRNSFITKESEFMDVFTEFLGEFWNSQSDPRRYLSLVNNACKVAKSISEYSGVIDTEKRKQIIDRAVGTSALEGLKPEDDDSDSLDVDRFVDLLF